MGFFDRLATYRLTEAVELVDGAIALRPCVRHHKSCMVNGIQVTGFESPSLSERYFLVEKWARTASGAVRVAMVMRPEMIDPQKFGVTVAFNRRLIADVFVTKASAIAWLDSDAPLSHRAAQPYANS